MHYYPHHIGDYQRDTASLSMAEHGAYRLMMDAYYVTEKPLPADLEALCRILRAMSKPERVAVQRVAALFFTANGDTLTHKRIDAEIASYQKESETRRQNGKKGGRPKNEESGNNRPGYLPDTERLGSRQPGTNLNQEPRTNIQKPVNTPQTPTAPPRECDRFDEFWKLYPRREAKADAIKAWRKIKPDEIQLILTAVPKHAASASWLKNDGQYIPLPASWLNARRWEDEGVKLGIQSDVRPLQQNDEEPPFLNDPNAIFHLSARP